ncbi:MAG: hypothetical protein M3405_09000 [Acidobacteriota bacterium]|jgi:MFS family permease|nr:hypothetical protein [Acidobacteriota bacterium]
MNLGECPDCRCLCSITAESCPKCGRVLKSGDIVKRKGLSAKYNPLLKLLAVIAGLVVSAISFAIVNLVVENLRSIFPRLVHERLVWHLVVLFSMFTIFFISYLLLGLIFGFLQHEVGWKWGLWLMSIPILFSILILMYNAIMLRFVFSSFVFLGIFSSLAGGLSGACVGVYITGIIKNKWFINDV